MHGAEDWSSLLNIRETPACRELLGSGAVAPLGVVLRHRALETARPRFKSWLPCLLQNAVSPSLCFFLCKMRMVISTGFIFNVTDGVKYFTIFANFKVLNLVLEVARNRGSERSTDFSKGTQQINGRSRTPVFSVLHYCALPACTPFSENYFHSPYGGAIVPSDYDLLTPCDWARASHLGQLYSLS